MSLALEREDGTRLLGGVIEAHSFRVKFVGLLGHASVDPDEGLWFAHTTSLHMLGMRCAIAVLWLSPPDADGLRTVTGARLLHPWRSLGFAPRGTDGALECHPDVLDRVRPGERVRLTEAA